MQGLDVPDYWVPVDRMRLANHVVMNPPIWDETCCARRSIRPKRAKTHYSADFAACSSAI